VFANVTRQADILARLRGHHAHFARVHDVKAWRRAVHDHCSAARGAVAHFRELAGGLEQGLVFYSGFMEAVRQLGQDCEVGRCRLNR
jgi:hypothetical protein